MSAAPAPRGREESGGVTLVLPRQLRELAGGEAAVRVQGRPATVGEALGALRAVQPAVYHRLVTETGELRPHINLFVDRRDVRRTGGLATPVGEEAEILILGSVSGG